MTVTFTNLFCFTSSHQVTSIVEYTIPSLVDSHMNSLQTMIIITEEISGVVKILNKFSAPSPDGFGGVFYHMY